MIIIGKWLFINNSKWGRLFAASSDKMDSDHIVETTDSFSNHDKYQWRLHPYGDDYLIENKAYGFMFSASGDKKGNDHIVKCNPDLDSLSKAKQAADNNLKYCWSVQIRSSGFQLINKRFGLMFSADEDLKGNDHIVETRPDSSENGNKWLWKMRPVEQFDGKNWMSQLPEHIRQHSIYTITMPGTHDSGTKSIAISIKLAVTQSTTIPEQLNMGVRFLDIRLKADGDDLSVCHGTLGSNYYFHQVISECQEFLRENPKEGILMSVKCDHGSDSDFAEIFERKYSHFFPSNKEIPTLEWTSGQIVLLRRFKSPQRGVRLSIPDNTPYSGDVGENGNRIFVQDEYDRDLEQAYIKKRVVQSFLERTDEEGLYINFVSATGTYYGIPDPKGMADKMNPWLTSILAERNKASGILVLDYATNSVADAIIAMNFR